MLFRRLITIAVVGTAALSLLSSFASPTSAYAQTSGPQLLVTWRASNSYLPSFYEGKALPSYGSSITAAVEVVANGSIVNVQNQPIYWYQDETKIGGGTGVQEVTFQPFGTPPSTVYLTVSLPQYPSGPLQEKVQIPYVNPVAVINAPYPAFTFSKNPVEVTAIPFYFNVSSPAALSYAWAVNGQAGASAENPQVADVTLPAGTPSGTGIDISLSVRNGAASTVATADEMLTYQSAL